MGRQWRSLDYGSYTITDTAGQFLGFADSGSPSTKPTGARSFLGIVETAPLRYRDDDTNPTSTEGVLVNPGDTIVLSETEIETIDMIRTTGTSAVLKGQFYQVEPNVLLGAT